MKYLTIGFGLVILCSEAVAQQVIWARDLVTTGLQEAGVYLTATAENNLRRQIGNDFVKNVPAGFSSNPSAFANAVAFGKIYSVGSGRVRWYVPNLEEGSNSLDDAPAKIPADATPSVRYLFSFTTVERLNTYLQKFSTIKINVEPVPPRDYAVVINGENCPATEKGEYKVMPGESTVKVTRPPKPSCDWSGSIAEGATQLVACKL